MSKERLEEIKEHVKWTVENGLQPRVEDSDLEWLINRVEELEKFKREAEYLYKNYHLSAKKSAEEKERYKQALEFYADEDNYRVTWDDDYEPILHDDGSIARQALEGEAGD